MDESLPAGKTGPMMVHRNSTFKRQTSYKKENLQKPIFLIKKNIQPKIF